MTKRSFITRRDESKKFMKLSRAICEVMNYKYGLKVWLKKISRTKQLQILEVNLAFESSFAAKRLLKS